MIVTLNDTEIKEALVGYTANQGIDLDNKNAEVSLIAGRGPNGMSAEIKISSATQAHKSKKATIVDPKPLEAPKPDGTAPLFGKEPETLEKTG